MTTGTFRMDLTPSLGMSGLNISSPNYSSVFLDIDSLITLFNVDSPNLHRPSEAKDLDEVCFIHYLSSQIVV